MTSSYRRLRQTNSNHIRDGTQGEFVARSEQVSFLLEKSRAVVVMGMTMKLGLDIASAIFGEGLAKQSRLSAFAAISAGLAAVWQAISLVV
jgi:lipid-binding SYLF domain-containing protein